eukprot:scaffold55875_cov26-Tisochrysis_lutea.AAC.7
MARAHCPAKSGSSTRSSERLEEVGLGLVRQLVDKVEDGALHSLVPYFGDLGVNLCIGRVEPSEHSLVILPVAVHHRGQHGHGVSMLEVGVSSLEARDEGILSEAPAYTPGKVFARVWPVDDVTNHTLWVRQGSEMST